MRNTWKPYFIWNGVNSIDMGIVVEKPPPVIRPGERVQKTEVPGRNGSLYVSDGTYENIVKSVEIGGFELKNKFEAVFSWLRGSGEVIFSTEPKWKYDAYIINQIPLEWATRRISKGVVQFDCQPFKREITETPIEITVPRTVTNMGTISSEPVITVYGQGAAEVVINNRAFTLNITDGYVVVDSEIKNAYKGTALMNTQMSGEFPFFDVGENFVSFSSGVSRMVILPKWRWL